MPTFISVTKEEFERFLATYPGELERNVTTTCEPPTVNFNDFERAPYWPDSVVASYNAFTSYEDSTPTGYRILEDINAPVEDIGVRDTDEPLLDRRGTEVKEGDRIRAHWGGSYSIEKGHVAYYNEHTAIIRDRGTKYERWSFDDCYNHLRGFDFEIIKR